MCNEDLLISRKSTHQNIDTETHASVFKTENNTRRINMPDFGSPFSGLANDRKLTADELIRAIRFMVAAEYEATQLYMQLAESTDNKLAVEVLKEIADEELVHVGEFLRLLRELAPDEEKLYTKGAKEVEGKIKKKK
jgi:demethoxyubiquinone hydroxylase (CLK1/Coq7/Cat5 family)